MSETLIRDLFPSAEESSRSSVLQASMTVFVRLGVEKTRVEDLLLEAHLSRRTFYKYFSSKEDVLAALYEGMTGALVNLLEVAAANESASLEDLLLGIDAFFDFHVLGGRLLQFLIEAASRSESALHGRRAWFRERTFAVLDAAVRRSTGRPLNQLVFHGLLALMEGLSLHVLQHHAAPEEVARAKAISRRVANELLLHPEVVNAPH